MDAAGLDHTGSARSPEEAAKPLLLDVHGVKVAQLSFTYGFNGIPLPHPWTANQLDPQRVIDAARRPCSEPTGRCSVRVPQTRASPVRTADAGEAVEPAPSGLLVGREVLEPVRLRRDRGHR